jgi:hypothetical protein
MTVFQVIKGDPPTTTQARPGPLMVAEGHRSATENASYYSSKEP